MKKVISIILVCILAFSVTACTNAEKNNQENTETQTQNQSSAGTEAETQSPSIETKNISVNVPVLKTSDWSSYSSTEYDGKSEMAVSFDIPKDYTSDATVVYNTDNVKFGEVVGVVPYADGQTLFDTVETNKNYGDIVYTDKTDGTLENGTKCAVLFGTAPIDDGEWYVFCYGIDFSDYAVIITLYSKDKLETMPAEHLAVLSNVKVD